MEDLNFNQAFKDLILNYQIKLIDIITSWDTETKKTTAYKTGKIYGLETARNLFIDTIKEMETKYNETL